MMMEGLLPALNGPNSEAAATAFSKLETRVNNNNKEAIHEFLRKWRCEPRQNMKIYNTVTKEFLKSLTIFKNLDVNVPLFIDDYGRKGLMSHYIDVVEKFKDFAEKYNPESGQATFSSLEGKQFPVKMKVNPEPKFSGLNIGIPIGSQDKHYWVKAEKIYIEVLPISLLLDTPIVHVTHTAEKISIVEDQKLKPSDNKNSVEGIWFSPKYNLSDPQDVFEPTSVYGRWAFETTLRRLGVSGIRQGEIVSYKNEVNFILYASDTVPPDPVMTKASDEAVMLTKDNADAYAAMSIFVSSRFLPQQGDAFWQAFEQPYEVSHQPFCVNALRHGGKRCHELTKSHNRK